nr:MAG TPA: hypothetical protein [Caudoviricetes sp.]
MTTEYALAAPVMMQLGDFQFGISTAAYQGLQRSDEWGWASQERLGQGPALQHTGWGAPTIGLDGVIYPEWRGGLGQLDAMRREAGKGRPLVLVDGLGRAMGMWVIEQLSETQSVFAAGGVARKIEFSLQLRRFSETVTGPVPTLPPLPVARPPISPAAETAAQKTASLADTVIAAAAPLLSSANGAWRSMQTQLAPATSFLKDAAGAAARCADAVRQLQAEAERVQAGAGLGPLEAASVVRIFGQRAGRLQAQAESAARILRRSVDYLESSPDEAVRAVINAMDCAHRTTALCRVVRSAASQIGAGAQGSDR